MATVLSPASLIPDFALEPGDRFEVLVRPACGDVLLPAGLTQQMESTDLTLEDEQGRLLAARFAGGIEQSALSFAGSGFSCEFPAWIEYRGGNQWRLLQDRTGPNRFAVSEITTEHGIRIVQEALDLSRFKEQQASLQTFELAQRAARLSTHAGFDQLISLPLVRDMEILEHQVRTAKTVLRRLRGRALLCDEVGLGKTIEAGLVLSELHLRGLARSILVLVPPSLIEQWQGEMRRKFSLELISQDAPEFRERGLAAWQEFDRVIVSLHTAKREPHRAAILQRRWDLVVIDEAHHLRNRNTQTWRFASELQKQFILLLTATPVQNNLEELFNLVTLLEPGLLSTAKQFQKHFVDRRDKLTPKNVNELHGLLSEVMIRNRRSTVGLQFTRRWASTQRVVMTAAEMNLYQQTAKFIRERMRQTQRGGVRPRMALLSLQMALGSSSRAAAGTLEKMAQHASWDDDSRKLLADLAERAKGIRENAKVDRLLKLLTEFTEKMVIFTQFRASQEMLADRLMEAGHELAVFHGGLSRLEKEAAIERFRGASRLLLCTESGSEGRNLQFAHAICNFDLPWNPMKIEQRIGRLSRIGQTEDVHVFNLVAADTVEAAVLHLLEAKLNLFELVIGEIDMILGNLDEEREFQDVVADTWAESSDGDDFSKRMEELGSRLLAAKAAYLTQREVDDRLFADRFAPDR